MILIGQFDSPFVRRVGIAMRLNGLAFEHRPWSVFGDAEKIRPYNPLTRVPVLVLEGGEALVESGAILDHIESLTPPERRLIPAAGPERRRALRIAGLASGIGDKAVALFYEIHLHQKASDYFVTRCKGQIRDTLARLERERAAVPGAYWGGARPDIADITVATILRHLTEAHAGLFDLGDCPALAAHCAAMEALEAFREIAQPFIPPA